MFGFFKSELMLFWHLSHLTKWRSYNWRNRKRLTTGFVKNRPTLFNEKQPLVISPKWSNNANIHSSLILLFLTNWGFSSFFAKSVMNRSELFYFQSSWYKYGAFKATTTTTTTSKTNWLNEQNNSSTLASRFLVFFYALHEYDVKPPDASSWCNVLWRRWTYDHEFSFLFLFWTWIESLRIQLQDANSFFSDPFTAVVDVIA